MNEKNRAGGTGGMSRTDLGTSAAKNPDTVPLINKSLLVTGTGTDVGKTIISAALLTGAARSGQPLSYWKPVQTGGSDLDHGIVQALFPQLQTAPLKVWSYPLPASPDQAAEAAGLPAVQLSAIIQQLPGEKLLIEGAGGLLVPLNQNNETWRDLAAAAQLPVLIVAQSGLGTINHTLLTLEACDNAGLQVLGVVLNGPEHKANLQSLARMRPDHRFLSFPWLNLESQDASWFAAADTLYAWVRALAVPDSSPWIEADQKHCWHPYTQHLTAPAPLPIVRAQGIHLYTDQGEKLVDASASWWTNSTGHGHPRIAAAIRRQHSRIDHCIFGGATHEPASLLAQRLAGLSQDLLPRIFYSDNGSCAVEVGLKMAAQSWQNQGVHDRHKFLFFKGAYHGDTFGAMSVGASEGFHKAFSPYLFAGRTLSPVTAHAARICPEGSAALPQGIAALEQMFQDHGRELAGVIIEPLLQGASGMNIQDLTWLQKLDQLCKQHRVPLILDEIFTGMGRLGSSFAFQRAGLTPDIVCISKGLTGGTLPLAVTMTTEAIFQSFLDTDGSKALLHGHTFTGNAIACAAALAALDIYETENILGRVAAAENCSLEWFDRKASRLGLIAPRAMGAVMAFELPGSGAGDYFHPLAQKVPIIARRHGLLMRTLGNTMYLVPPLSIEASEMLDTLERMERTLGDLM